MFFWVFLGLVFSWKLRGPKNSFLGVLRASGGQLGRFWGPTWPQKGSQNRCFWWLKLDLMLNKQKKWKFDSRFSETHILTPLATPKTLQKSSKNQCQEPSKLKPFFETLPTRPRSPPGALLEGIFGKKVKFWCPSWAQVGLMLGPRSDKKVTKKGTYVKTPLGLHFGTVFGSILVSFWGRFLCCFGRFLKCFFFLFPLSLLCFAC